MEDPQKVTLYLPEKLLKEGRRHAEVIDRTSLSNLVSGLLEAHIGDCVNVILPMSREDRESVYKLAMKRGVTFDLMHKYLVSQGLAAELQKPDPPLPPPKTPSNSGEEE